MGLNSGRLKGAVDRELGGEYIQFFPQFSKILDFEEFRRKTNFILRFLRIRPVQSVANDPTQLSGRGFPYGIVFAATLRFFFGTSKWKLGHVI